MVYDMVVYVYVGVNNNNNNSNKNNKVIVRRNIKGIIYILVCISINSCK